MSHHGPNPFDAYDGKTQRRMQDLLREKTTNAFRQANTGPTGQFPDGKMFKHDEGEIAFAVGHPNGKVVLDFGSPVAWVGMEPMQAIALANSLISHAKKARIIGAPKNETRHKAQVAADDGCG